MNIGTFWIRLSGSNEKPVFEKASGYVIRKYGYRFGIINTKSGDLKGYAGIDLRTGYQISEGSTLHEAMRPICPEPTAELVKDYKEDMTELWIHTIDNPDPDVLLPVY